ncbi:MAG: NUDIX domain-containing protein [Dehalococcoidia bacterium]|nr:NUDIX domain-containing protein [Dehalococcoidia bacterium]
MNEERVKKVTAIVLRKGMSCTELLVFDHPMDEGGVMVQLPAGTVEPDEQPEAAVVRELQEEACIHGQLIALAGVRDEELDGEKRRRWVYLLRAPEGLPDEWPSNCDCGAPTRCHWVPFERAEIMEAQQPWVELAREWVKASS